MRSRFTSRASIVAATAATLAIHSACYLYFFVDDEAIPLVYARHLLDGRGLVYTAAEGRVEGYSDFLHVIWSAGLLALTRLLRVDALDAMRIGSAVNLVLGVATLLITARILARDGADNPSMLSGLGFLALAGPLALWSCSSLETVPFACAFTALSAIVLPGGDVRDRYLPAALAAFVLLERLDGFVYVGALLLAALICSPPQRVRDLARFVVVPALLLAAAYHGCRFAYFGSVLSEPLKSKVLYKVSSAGHLIEKAPPRLYLTGFLTLYGAVIVPAAIAATIGARRSPRTKAVLIAVALLTGYVQTVGDWMFGWRFVVALVPLLSIMIAAAVQIAPSSRTRWALAVLVVAASATGAHAFAERYEANEERPIWWTHPGLGRSYWLAPYGDLITAAHRTVARGDVIAYNQAGLLPFVLDAQNIDDLGICSSFEAELPTTDVFFTEVGRYAPLTNAPVFGAQHAYLLYRDVKVLISRTDLLIKANNAIPRELLGGYFRLSEIDKSGANAIYVRTSRDASAYQRDPGLFWQNLAHTSRIRGADVDGVRLTDDRLGPEFPYLRWGTGTIGLPHDRRIDIRFADHDEDVRAFYVSAISATPAVAVTFNLYDEKGRLVASEDAQADETPAPLLLRYDEPVHARTLSIEARPASPGARLRLTDVRVEGQSAALRDYVARRLRFSGE